MKMAYRKNNKKHQSGFTLIEVIAVLVIIAVLAADAVSRVISTKEVSAITERGKGTFLSRISGTHRCVPLVMMKAGGFPATEQPIRF